MKKVKQVTEKSDIMAVREEDASNDIYYFEKEDELNSYDLFYPNGYPKNGKVKIGIPKVKIQDNIFWGYEPQFGGSYCNINMNTGMINYMPPHWMPTLDKPSGCTIFEAIKKYSRLDDMVKNTITAFAEYDLDLFNKFINNEN